MADYTLKIDIDTSALEAMKRLSSVGRRVVSGGGEGGDSRFWANFSQHLTRVLRIAGISVGIGGIFYTLLKSSSILQGVFDLFQESVMMIFRPIGDMLGLFLLPIVLLFLEKVALPFYETLLPFYESVFGAGEAIANFFSNPAKYISDGVAGVVEAIKSIVISPIINVGEAIGGINLAMSGAEQAWNNIVNFFNGMGEGVQAINRGFSALVGLFSGIWVVANTVLSQAWGAVVGFFVSIWQVINNVLSSAWGAVVGFFVMLSAVITRVLLGAWSKVVEFFMWVGNTVMATLRSVWEGIVSFFTSIYNTLRSIAGMLASLSFGLFTVGGGGTSVKKMQYGGVISEPVLGLGLASGSRYLLGEAGAEVVMPISGGGGVVVNLNITMNVTKEVDARQVISIIERELKTILNRRGVF